MTKENKKDVKILILINIFIILVLFSKFILFDNAYVFNNGDIGSDTINSYWPYYKHIVESLKIGNLNFWDFNLGIGTNILTLSQLLFDPFNIIMFLFPIDYIQYSFIIIMILKILISSTIMYIYLKKLNIHDRVALIFSIIWGFNGYIMLWGQHYMFATAIVFFTLLIYSTEIFIKENKKKLFYFSIFIFAINSPYLLYGSTIYIGLYSIFRYVYIYYGDIKKIIISVLRFISNYLIGLGISAFIFLPICYLIISSPRLTSGSYDIGVLKTWDLFSLATNFTRIFSNNLLGVNNSYIGYSNYYESMMLSSSILCIILIPQLFLFYRNNNKIRNIIIISVILCIISFIFKFPSYIFNGFNNDIQTRWGFIINFTTILGASFSLNYIFKNKELNIPLLLITNILIMMFIFISIVYVYYFTEMGISKQTIFSTFFSISVVIFIMIIFSVILISYKHKKYTLNTLILFVILELILNNYLTINMRINVDENMIISKQGYYDNTEKAINYIKSKDDSFYRLDKEYISVFLNDSVYQNYYGINSYNSLNTGSWIEFLNNLELMKSHINYVYPITDRIRLLSFLGTKYILSKESIDNIGYEYMSTIDNINIYKNNNAFPLGFTYNSYLPKEEFNKLDNTIKEDVLLNTVILENDINYLDKYNIKDYNKVNFNYESSKDIELDNQLQNTYDVVGIDPNINISFEDKVNNGVLLKMNIDSSINNVGQIFYSNNNTFTEEKSIMFEISPNKKEYHISIESSDISNIRIDIGQEGQKITIENLSIFEKSNISDSRKDKDIFNITNFKESNIKGNINIENKKILTWSIPYCKGWKVKVDGKYVEPIKVNMGFLGIELDEGYHDIELVYIPPFMIIGLLISLSTLFILILSSIYNNKNKILNI